MEFQMLDQSSPNLEVSVVYKASE